jgi:hypothetical protein
MRRQIAINSPKFSVIQLNLYDTEVTDSKVAPFSDKIMMFMATTLTALRIGYYGTSMATSTRKDLALDYVHLSAEIASFAEDLSQNYDK